MLRFRALERLSSRGLLPGLGSTTLPREHVGDDIMAERRVRAVGLEFQSCPRQPDCFVQILFEVEVELGEEQMPFRKTRVDFDRLPVLRDLPLAIDRKSVV